MSKSVLPPYYIFEAGSERKWPFWSSLLPPKECTHQTLNCWWSSITVIRCWSAFLKSSWTDSRPSSTLGRLVCHAMNADHITPVLKDLHWLRIQGKDPLQAMCPWVQVSTQTGTTLPVRPTSTSRSNRAQTASEIHLFIHSNFKQVKSIKQSGINNTR